MYSILVVSSCVIFQTSAHPTHSFNSILNSLFASIVFVVPLSALVYVTMGSGVVDFVQNRKDEKNAKKRNDLIFMVLLLLNRVNAGLRLVERGNVKQPRVLAMPLLSFDIFI